MEKNRRPLDHLLPSLEYLLLITCADDGDYCFLPLSVRLTMQEGQLYYSPNRSFRKDLANYLAFCQIKKEVQVLQARLESINLPVIGLFLGDREEARRTIIEMNKSKQSQGGN